jgi:uncharacterized protein (TIGR02145 family)
MKKILFPLFALSVISALQAQTNFSTVKIGDQTWIAKNLDVDHYRNGDPIPHVTDPTAWAYLTTGAWCYNNNDSANGNTYGKLYNWYAVNDPRGLAPAGWHIPSDAEWTTLEKSLSGSSEAGGKMKEAGMLHWETPNTGGNNNSGWAGLPGGCRSVNGFFSIVKENGYWWSSSESNPPLAWIRILSFNTNRIARSTGYEYFGYSVRCIKD